MHATKKIRQLAGESAVYGLAGGLSRLIGFFMIPVYTRVFTPEDLGTVALIDATAYVLTMLGILGLDGATARWFYDSPDAEDQLQTVASSFWCQLLASLLIAGSMISFANPISQVLCGTDYHADLVRLAALTLPPITVVRVFGGWLRYRRKAPAVATYVTFRSLVSIGLIILFVVVWNGGLTGFFTARLIAIIIAAALGVVFLGPWINPRRVSRQRLSEMLTFGLPLVPAAIGAWVMNSADRFVLCIFWPQEVVGLYDLGSRVAAGVGLMIFAFQQAWGPFAYSLLDKDDAQRVYARVWDVYAFFGCWLATAIGLFAPFILRVMATEQFYPAASCVAILAFVYLLIGARTIAALGSGIAKRSLPVAAAIGLGAVVNIILNFLLVPHWGREGAALGTAAAALVSLIYLFIASQAGHAIEYRWRISIISAISAVLLVSIAWLCVPQTTLSGLTIRFLMLLTFIPLGTLLGIIQRQRLQDFFSR